jgi:hypothetical protein
MRGSARAPVFSLPSAKRPTASQTSRQYTQRQADGVIRGSQNLGVTVESFFNEIDFIEAVIHGSRWTVSARMVAGLQLALPLAHERAED